MPATLLRRAINSYGKPRMCAAGAHSFWLKLALLIERTSGKKRPLVDERETNFNVAFVQVNDVFAVHRLLRAGNESVDGIFERVEPFAVIDHFCPLRVKLAFQLDLLFCQAELLQVAMHFQQDGGGGSLVNLARLQAHDAILEEVDLADAVGAAEDVQLLDDRVKRQLLAIQGNGQTILPCQRNGGGCIGRFCGGVSHIQMESGSSVSRPMPPLAIERHHMVLSSPPAITSSTGTP